MKVGGKRNRADALDTFDRNSLPSERKNVRPVPQANWTGKHAVLDRHSQHFDTGPKNQVRERNHKQSDDNHCFPRVDQDNANQERHQRCYERAEQVQGIRYLDTTRGKKGRLRSAGRLPRRSPKRFGLAVQRIGLSPLAALLPASTAPHLIRQTGAAPSPVGFHAKPGL